MPVVLTEQTAASVTTPASGKTSVFVDSSSGALSLKDDAGTVTALGAGGGGTDLGWFDVTDYGATGDGTTDDTTAIQDAIDAAGTAGGGVVYFPAGVYIVGGAAQDASGANAQLLLPSIHAVDSEQITIVLRGAAPPPVVASVVGATPLPDNLSVIKGTLNTGAGVALLGGTGPSGSAGNFTNLFLQVRDLAFRLPSNPVLTACNFTRVAAIDIDNVWIDCGNYYVQGLTEPTTTTSYGLRTPGTGNGAYTRFGAVNVVGFYNGYEFCEHSVGEQVAAWGCKQAFVFAAATNHASHFQRLMAVHCERGIVATGSHVVDISQFNIEHAASGWWITDYDVDDASSFLKGGCRWHVVLAGTGPDNTFTVNGATQFSRRQIGAALDGWSGLIETPTDKTYCLVLKAPCAGRIVEATTKSASGTCTATFKINSTSLGGTANSVSSVEQSQAHSTSNVFAVGDDINLTVSANSSCADMAFTLRFQPL